MFALTNGIMSLIYLLVRWFFFAIIVAAFVNALMRPAGDFARASKNKNFWVIFLALSLVVGFDATVYPILPSLSYLVSTLLWLVALSGAIYYLSAERQRMGGSGWSFGR